MDDCWEYPENPGTCGKHARKLDYCRREKDAQRYHDCQREFDAVSRLIARKWALSDWRGATDKEAYRESYQRIAFNYHFAHAIYFCQLSPLPAGPKCRAASTAPTEHPDAA